MPVSDKHIYFELTCEICGAVYKQRSSIYRKAKWKNRCPSHRGKYWNDRTFSIDPLGVNQGKCNKCIDCGAPIWNGGVRCRVCSNKSRAMPKQYCVDCGVEIQKNSTRCLSCHNIKQDKGASRERTKFNNSDKWRGIRVACFERDEYTCGLCGDHNYSGRKDGSVFLEAHHILEYNSFPNHRLILNNLITLCQKCHLKWHHNKEFKFNNICRLL